MAVYAPSTFACIVGCLSHLKNLFIFYVGPDALVEQIGDNTFSRWKNCVAAVAA
jgi:hypothetical protein